MFLQVPSKKRMVKKCVPPVVLLIVLLTWYITRQGMVSQLQNDKSMSESTIKHAPTVSMTSSQNKATTVSSGLVDGPKISEMLEVAAVHVRKRKMYDLTNDPYNNNLQVLVNAWTEGSYSPIHMHKDYDEVFVALEGYMAFFTFDKEGKEPTCHILSPQSHEGVRLIVVEKGGYHALTAAPSSMGYPGHAVVMESSAHLLEPHKVTKFLSAHYSSENSGQDGVKSDFDLLLKFCPVAPAISGTVDVPPAS